MGILTDNNIIQSIYQKGKGKRYVQFVFGCLLVALAFNLFYAPNDIVAGGVSGLSLVLKHIFGINSSMFILIANLFLLVLSYFFLGKETTKMTIFGSLLFPLLVNLTQNLSTYISFQQTELILVAVFGGLLQGIGAGLIFKAGFTTGGTDILNMIVSRKLHISMGNAILLTDGLIVLSGFFVFGFNRLIYALIVLYLVSFAKSLLDDFFVAKFVFDQLDQIRRRSTDFLSPPYFSLCHHAIFRRGGRWSALLCSGA